MHLLGISSLSELLDMFHSHEATKPVDKVYALPGMSSDAGPAPDYQIALEYVIRSLIRLLLCKQVSVEICGDKQMAVIKSKGCVLGGCCQ